MIYLLLSDESKIIKSQAFFNLMLPKSQFCCQTFASSFEGLHGTVPLINKLLLIEYNRPWSDEPISKNSLPHELNSYLQECIDNGIYSRLMFIKNTQSQNREKINVFAINNCDEQPFANHFEIHSHEELLTTDLAKYFASNSKNRYNQQLYLVCTNGKVDKCCSKFGLPIYRALQKYDTPVWECTHITGCRFAPNVVTAPYLHYYGHLTLEDLPELHKSAMNRKIYRSKYRGRTCFTNEEQAAEYFLRQQLDDYNYDNLIKTGISNQSELYSISFYHKDSSKEFTVRMTSEKSQEDYLMNCSSVMKPVDIFSLIDISSGATI